MVVEKFFKESILQTLFDARKEDFEYHIQKTSIENKEKRDSIEKRLKEILNYVNGEHYDYIQNEMEEILWEMMDYATFWNDLFYKFGIVDGMNLKREIKEELEKKLNG